jgi:hypothetical protein
MVQDHLQFARRLKRLLKKHQAMSYGYRAELANDGLLVFKPKRKVFGISDPTGSVSQMARKPGFFARGGGQPTIKTGNVARRGVSLRSLVIFAAAFIAFKAFLMYQFGPAGYQARIDAMADGAMIEKAGAWIMQIDPVTAFVFNQINYFLV